MDKRRILIVDCGEDEDCDFCKDKARWFDLPISDCDLQKLRGMIDLGMHYIKIHYVGDNYG